MVLGGAATIGMSPSATAAQPSTAQTLPSQVTARVALTEDVYNAILTVPPRLVIAQQNTPMHFSVSLFGPVDGAEWTDVVARWTQTPLMVSDSHQLGVFTQRGICNFMGPEGGCRANSPTTDIRVGSWGGVTSTSRSSGKVSITTSSHRYATSLNRLIPWREVYGIIQYRNVGSTTWTNLKQVHPDPTGHYTYTYTVSTVRDYRLVQADAPPYIWGHTSNIARR